MKNRTKLTSREIYIRASSQKHSSIFGWCLLLRLALSGWSWRRKRRWNLMLVNTCKCVCVCERERRWCSCFPSDPREKSLGTSLCVLFIGVCLGEMVGASPDLGGRRGGSGVAVGPCPQLRVSLVHQPRVVFSLETRLRSSLGCHRSSSPSAG